ncbi:MAG: LysR family transcriptional regulator [Rhodospirillales bacterium]|nr:LysR family transcriptional regulator [Rhodospirillales bacterium]MDE2458419.1 LysR family transcriptional regulator [Rhodospirillales bacterium]
MFPKLEYLIVLAREKHFGRAAEACGVTQPSFSAAIRALEDMMGLPLVIRSSRFQGFTPEGEVMLDWARRITSDVRAMRDEVTGLRHGLSGVMRLAVIPTALAVVADITTPFRALHPNVRFNVQSCTSAELLQRLMNAEIDAGITYLDNEPVAKTRFAPLYDERYYLLTTRVAPLGDREKVSWAEIAQIPLCLLTPDMQNRRIIDRLLGQAGAAVVPVLESNSILVLVSHVKTKQWACVLPEKLVGVFGLGADLLAIPIVQPEEVHKVGLVVAERTPLSPLTAALLAQIGENKFS